MVVALVGVWAGLAVLTIVTFDETVTSGARCAVHAIDKPLKAPQLHHVTRACMLRDLSHRGNYSAGRRNLAIPSPVEWNYFHFPRGQKIHDD